MPRVGKPQLTRQAPAQGDLQVPALVEDRPVDDRVALSLRLGSDIFRQLALDLAEVILVVIYRDAAKSVLPVPVLDAGVVKSEPARSRLPSILVEQLQDRGPNAQAFSGPLLLARATDFVVQTDDGFFQPVQLWFRWATARGTGVEDGANFLVSHIACLSSFAPAGA